ncbi:PREDICTED: uncharacterized protein LOC109189096 isoform X2 [Ipomoea nil]|uniref:uncharacterized protein LOC109189096 isoform X2 n=1 Tax=Ipomoea nil TaxID=35883 RepID=UPI0009015538|nr:PREDICTED: uncharacterized protein LOC109189096 isoform X2 [Ipomoea nil]
MQGARHCPRINTVELKLQIGRKIGKEKARMYFSLLSRFIRLKVNKVEFDKVCISMLGRENICLHNALIQGMIKNASFADTPPTKDHKMLASLNVVPLSPRKGRTPTLRDHRPSPLGPHVKTTHTAICEDSAPKVQELQSATELLSLGSRHPVEVVTSVEDGEEVEQAGSPGIYSKSPLTAPFGVSMIARAKKKVLLHGLASSPYRETCHSTRELPDISSLMKRLEQKLEAEGLKISSDCVNLINNGLDGYLKRLIKPCMALAASKSRDKVVQQHSVPTLNGIRTVRYLQKMRGSPSISMEDFRVAMELNPRILGEDWPIQLEKVSQSNSVTETGS